jgi:uncharacterized protein (TIGR00297 family)
MLEWLFVIIFILTGSLVGYRFHFLSKSGAIAAIVVGFSIAIGTKWEGLSLLAIFFISSSLWSKYKKQQKEKVEEKLDKGSRRDWQQVVANGGIPSIMSLAYAITHDPLWVIGFTIAIASSNSDTWASEVGPLSKTRPVLIRSFRHVDRGTSGAVSLLGTVASLCGSLLIAGVAAYFFEFSFNELFMLTLFGFLGNIIDTLFGAYLQVVFQCEQCGLETEKTRHCERYTTYLKGIPILNNEAVNFISSLVAVFFGCLWFSMYSLQ